MVIRKSTPTVQVTDISPTKVEPIRAIDFASTPSGPTQISGGAIIKGGRVGGRFTTGGGGGGRVVSATDVASREAAERILAEERSAAKLAELNRLKSQEAAKKREAAALRKEELVTGLSEKQRQEAFEKQAFIAEAGARDFAEGERQREAERLRKIQEEKLAGVTVTEPAAFTTKIARKVKSNVVKNIAKTVETARLQKERQNLISFNLREQGFVKTSKLLIREQDFGAIPTLAFEAGGQKITDLSVKLADIKIPALESSRPRPFETTTLSDKIRVQQSVGRLLQFGTVFPLFQSTATIERTIGEQQQALVIGQTQKIAAGKDTVVLQAKTVGGKIAGGVGGVQSKTAGPLTISRSGFVGEVTRKPIAPSFPTRVLASKGTEKFTTDAVSVSLKVGKRTFFEGTAGFIKTAKGVEFFTGSGSGLQGAARGLPTAIQKGLVSTGGPSTQFVSIVQRTPTVSGVGTTFKIPGLDPSGITKIPVSTSLFPLTAGKAAPSFINIKSITPVAPSLSLTTTGLSQSISAVFTPSVTTAPLGTIAGGLQIIPVSTAPRTSELTRTGNIAIVTPRTDQGIRTVNRVVPTVSTPTRTTTGTIQTPIVIPKQVTPVVNIPRIPIPTITESPRTTTPVFPFRITTTRVPPPISFRTRARISTSAARTFGVSVRRGGRFRPIGRGLSVSQAISVGATRVRGSIAATFKITPEQPGRVTGVRTPRQFRKRKGLTFVELPKFRLDTPGEIRGIKTGSIKI